MLGTSAPELAETTHGSKCQTEHKGMEVEGSRGGATWTREGKEPDSLSEEQLSPTQQAPRLPSPRRRKIRASRPRNEEAATTQIRPRLDCLFSIWCTGLTAGSLHIGMHTLSA